MSPRLARAAPEYGLAPDQVEHLVTQGFLVVPSLLERSSVDEVRGLLDPLFERFEDLPSHIKRDLGASNPQSEANVRSAEISRPISLERRLRKTLVYRACRTLARQLSGSTAAYSFDHAIYKAPFNERETSWHQDQAYTGHHRSLRTLHFWIPLQDVTIENGCMQFLPRSNRLGIREHVRHANGHTLVVPDMDSASAIACPIQAGGLTIHTPLTLHYTGPNNSAEIRRAWIIHFGPWGLAAKLHPAIWGTRLRARAGRGSSQ